MVKKPIPPEGLEWDTHFDYEGPNICKLCHEGNSEDDINRLDSQGICYSCWEEAGFDPGWEDHMVPKSLRERWERGERFTPKNGETKEDYLTRMRNHYRPTTHCPTCGKEVD